MIGKGSQSGSPVSSLRKVMSCWVRTNHLNALVGGNKEAVSECTPSL